MKIACAISNMDAKPESSDLIAAIPQANMPAMISLQQVSVEFPGGIRAVDDVSLRLEPGSFTVLLGRSGSGKSTLLRLCNGLQLPSSGSVVIDGHGSPRSAAQWRRHRLDTAMVFQAHQLLPRWTALANAMVGAIGRRPLFAGILPPPRAEVILALDALARVGLADKARIRVDQLSGGERQRVGIARALVQRPTLVLADEPVASLDPATGGQVLDLLRTVCRQDGLTALVSLHQVDLTRRVADRVVALAHGRVVFDGPPGDLSGDVETDIYLHQPSRRPTPVILGQPALIGV